MNCVIRNLVPATLAVAAAACTAPARLPTVDHVDLQRFMGDWYVIANIPTRFERGAHNAVESYRLDDDGTVATTFRFREGGFDGELKQFRPRGFVRNTETNAEWGMQFVWPFRADYRIVYLDPQYRITIIGRNKRDFVWLMARQPEIPQARYRELVERIGAMGYDVDQLQKVPQRW